MAAQANTKDESKPINESLQQLYTAYGTAPHATFQAPPGAGEMYGHTHIVDYEPAKLSSFRVCCVQRGTILQDPILFVEQFMITMVFLALAVPVYIYFGRMMEIDVGVGNKQPEMKMQLSRFVAEQEGKMRAFAMIMTTLAAFLLSFYTSIAVGRWWIMRTAGVGGIKAATVDLELLLLQNVTQEPQVLSAVRRYGRASLMLLFLWRRHQLDQIGRVLVEREMLDQHEVEQLLKYNHCLHETIWAWQSGIVSMLYKEGKIKSDQLFQKLLEKCLDGRSSVQLLHTYLAVRVPMQYVHLLGLLVKMHNTVLAIIMGVLSGAALRSGDLIICIQCFMRTLILPFLFNAILLINAGLSDPFDGSETNFPGVIYQGALEKDCQGMLQATQNMPDWLAKRYAAEA